MATGWSLVEVEATVSSYFAMLDRELRGDAYNKTEFRRHLKNLLDGRSDAAIERKHQNISAILIELGFPYISGYKPLGNYQRLLYDVVDRRLTDATELKTVAAERAIEPTNAPVLNDLLSRIVEPPRLERPTRSGVADRSYRSPKTDYLAMEARNRSLGAAGEEFTVEYEQARLSSAGQGNLADRVERISVSRGEAEGYDVLSFEVSGRERLIEVKTTSYGDSTPFFVSPNELATSSDRSDQYFLYRLFEFRTDPKLFVVAGDISRSFDLMPSQFLARLSS